MERDRHELELTEDDIRFVVDEVEAGGLSPEGLRQLVRSDPSFRDAVLSDGRVFDKAASADEELLRISPTLYFQVLLRRARKDLGQVSHTLERSGSETVVVFDSDDVGSFLGKPTVTDYLAAMLASFTRVESYVMPVRVRRGTWRRVRFSDMDIDSLARLAASVDEEHRFRYFKRIADVCLFILGIFPSSAASAGQRGFAAVVGGGGRRRSTRRWGSGTTARRWSTRRRTSRGWRSRWSCCVTTSQWRARRSTSSQNNTYGTPGRACSMWEYRRYWLCVCSDYFSDMTAPP